MREMAYKTMLPLVPPFYQKQHQRPCVACLLHAFAVASNLCSVALPVTATAKRWSMLIWAAWYITRLLVKLTPEGVVFSFLLFYAYVIASGAAGTRSVGMMFRAVVFTFMPTAIELVLVCTLLAQRFKPAVALAVLATFVAYVAWTTVMTKVSNTDLCSSQSLLSW